MSDTRRRQAQDSGVREHSDRMLSNQMNLIHTRRGSTTGGSLQVEDGSLRESIVDCHQQSTIDQSLPSVTISTIRSVVP